MGQTGPDYYRRGLWLRGLLDVACYKITDRPGQAECVTLLEALRVGADLDARHVVSDAGDAVVL